MKSLIKKFTHGLQHINEQEIKYALPRLRAAAVTFCTDLGEMGMR